MYKYREWLSVHKCARPQTTGELRPRPQDLFSYDFVQAIGGGRTDDREPPRIRGLTEKSDHVRTSDSLKTFNM